MKDGEVLRGWEVTRAMGAVSVFRYAPTELGARLAAADAKWLSGRHPNLGYEMRALVSMPREIPALVLDADESNQEALVAARVADGAFDISDVEPNEPPAQ